MAVSICMLACGDLKHACSMEASEDQMCGHDVRTLEDRCSWGTPLQGGCCWMEHE